MQQVFKLNPLLFILLFLLLFPSISVDLKLIKLQQGFQIDIFANVSNPRQMVRSEKGTIFVSTINDGKVYAIKDTNDDFKADIIKIIATGLNMPNGVALKNGSLYVAEVSRIIRFDDIENNLDNPKYVIVKNDLPQQTDHGWKFIDFGPDGKLYIPIGAPCDTCDRGDPYATICRMNPDGTQFQIFARGIRNTVGFDWDPRTGYMWFTDNGRDNLGDEIPPDELNYASKNGSHFGYPYCHGSDIKDPQFGTKNCSQYIQPKLNFEAHVAALGVNFYTYNLFPEKYQGGMFIAQHGSWNRKQKIGYRVIFVKIDKDQIIYNEVFAEGWLQGSETKGRPVDTEQLSDGSLLVSDDYSGAIYRIYYKTKKVAQNEGEGSNAGKIMIIIGSVLAFIGFLALSFTLFKYCKKKRLNKNMQEKPNKDQKGLASSENIVHGQV